MTKLEKLIKELCPNGVEYVKLSSVCVRQKGISLTAGEMRKIDKTNAPIRLFAAGNTVANVNYEDIPQECIITKPSIIVKSRGNIGFEYYDKPFSHKNELWSYSLKGEEANLKYIYYYLQAHSTEFQLKAKTGKLPQISTGDTDDYKIPLPPLAVQCKIVRILDDFTSFSAELAAELVARYKQYKYYRDKLLTFEESNEGYEVRWLKLGEICDTITDYVAAGSFADLKKNVQYLQNADYAQLVRTTDLKSKFKNEDFVYIAETAYNYLWRVHLDEASIIMPNIGNCGEVYYVDPRKLPYSKNALGPNAILLRSSKEDNKYLYYIFQCEQFQKQLKLITSPGGQCKFNKTDLKKLIVPVPPLEVQGKIVETLDKFDKLCNDLTEGLPAEIEARQKQYEYYRDKLLTFQTV